MTEWDEIASVKAMKHYDDEKEMETDEPPSLEERVEYLLDVLEAKEREFIWLKNEVETFTKRWLNHRHGVGQGVYSGKGER